MPVQDSKRMMPGENELFKDPDAKNQPFYMWIEKASEYSFSKDAEMSPLLLAC